MPTARPCQIKLGCNSSRTPTSRQQGMTQGNGHDHDQNNVRARISRGRLNRSRRDGSHDLPDNACPLPMPGGTGEGEGVAEFHPAAATRSDRRAPDNQMAVKRILFLALLLSLALPLVAHAQNIATLNTGNAHGIDTVLAGLKAAVDRWSGPLTTIALELFGSLALIAFVMEVGFTWLNGGLDLVSLFALVIRQGVVLGAWVWVVQNWSQGRQFGRAILASFQIAGQQAGGVPSSPGDIFELGVGFASKLMQQTSVLGTVVDPGRTITLGVCALAIVIIFAGIAAIVLVTMAKAMIVASVGTLSLGFAGAGMTRSVALNALWMVLGSGARVLAQLLLLSFGVDILRRAFGDAGPLDATGAFGVIGLAIVIGALVWSVPAAAEHLFHGTGHGTASLGHAMRATGQMVM